jgi:hypothetical protein
MMLTILSIYSVIQTIETPPIHITLPLLSRQTEGVTVVLDSDEITLPNLTPHPVSQAKRANDDQDLDPRVPGYCSYPHPSPWK